MLRSTRTLSRTLRIIDKAGRWLHLSFSKLCDSYSCSVGNGSGKDVGRCKDEEREEGGWTHFGGFDFFIKWNVERES